MSHDFRMTATHEAYEQIKQTGHLDTCCPLCDEVSIKEFTHWRIITNNYPYDAITQVHHMLVPKRHCKEDALTDSERAELLTLKEDDLDEYDFLLESNRHKRSIPAHFHIHLLVPKENI
jgi:diadenosine tetraphosphate (Ap4A) HIT family hydrolase